jgi:hypothetical protein
MQPAPKPALAPVRALRCPYWPAAPRLRYTCIQRETTRKMLLLFQKSHRDPGTRAIKPGRLDKPRAAFCHAKQRIRSCT